MTDRAAIRRRELALIHMGAKEVGLDDEAYRDMLRAVAGVDSAGALDARGRQDVIRHLKSCGFRPSPTGSRLRPTEGRPGRPGDPVAQVKAGLVVGEDQKPQEALILALWKELERLGAFRYGMHARLDTFMRRCGVPIAHPRFCTPAQASKVIEALKSWLRRAERRAQGKPRG